MKADQDIIQAFVENVRRTIEPHWSADLLFENFKPLPEDTKSAGYCGPSSILLWQRLIQEFPEETFSLAVGRVYSNQKEQIRGKHVWVMWHQKLRTSIVLDITADQDRQTTSPCVTENIDTLAKRGVYYIVYQLAKDPSEVDTSALRRSQMLRNRIDGTI